MNSDFLVIQCHLLSQIPLFVFTKITLTKSIHCCEKFLENSRRGGFKVNIHGKFTWIFILAFASTCTFKEIFLEFSLDFAIVYLCVNDFLDLFANVVLFPETVPKPHHLDKAGAEKHILTLHCNAAPRRWL
jgi:hypothetical protein